VRTVSSASRAEEFRVGLASIVADEVSNRIHAGFIPAARIHLPTSAFARRMAGTRERARDFPARRNFRQHVRALHDFSRVIHVHFTISRISHGVQSKGT